MSQSDDSSISGFPLVTTTSEPMLPDLRLAAFKINDRVKTLVLEARDVLKDELEGETDDFSLVEAADIAHENETSSVVSEHYCYLRGMADALNVTIVELFDACLKVEA
jgi:hypothetical protein